MHDKYEYYFKTEFTYATKLTNESGNVKLYK